MSGPNESRRRAVTAAVVVGSVAFAAWQGGADAGALFDGSGLSTMGEVVGAFFSPDLSPSFLARIGSLALESVLIGALGTALAVIFGVPLAVAAARVPRLPDPPAQAGWRNRGRAAVRWSARSLLSFFRAVPEIVWAFLFVRIFGLGPGPAVLAIGLSFGGIIGRLYAELVESVDPEPVHQLRASGAGPLAVFLYGVYPQVRSQWVGYALFRLECAIRSASILGVVGAGGLGQEIELSIRYFEYDKLATALLAVLAYVVALEVAGTQLRKARGAVAWGALALGAVLGLAHLDIPWSELLASESGRQVVAFLEGFARPNLDGAFVTRALSLAATTVAMAWAGTAAAAAVAFVLAPMSARQFTVGTYLRDAPRARGPGKWGLAATLVLARGVLIVTRALPELVWALLFILWVGPGPMAGLMAIGAHTIGILGRLYSDALEEVEPVPPRVLEASGAGAVARYVYGVLPQAFPRLVSYTLFRFEVNIRLAAMVGFVGAGGLGDAIHTAISLFHMSDLATLLLTLLGTVLLFDTLSTRLRRR